MRLLPLPLMWVGLGLLACGRAAPPPEQPAPSPTTVEAYFFADIATADGRAGPFLVAVQRRVEAGGAPIEQALLALLAGPTEEELAAVPAISSAVPAGSSLLGVEVADGLAIIDLSPTFETGGGSFSVRGRLAQVVFTATQFPDVESVRLMLAGRPVEVFSGEGIVIEHPLTRADFRDLLP